MSKVIPDRSKEDVRVKASNLDFFFFSFFSMLLPPHFLKYSHLKRFQVSVTYFPIRFFQNFLDYLAKVFTILFFVVFPKNSIKKYPYYCFTSIYVKSYVRKCLKIMLNYS